MTLKNGFGIKVFVICFLSQWTKRSNMDSSFSRQRKPKYGELALFDWPIVLLYDVKAKYRLISRNKLFHPIVRLTNQKSLAFVSVR